MPYGDERSGMERRTTGQLRPHGTRIRKLYKDHDSSHREEYQEAMSPYQRHYTTTGEDRKSHRPNRQNVTGSPPPDLEQYTASSSRKKNRGTSDLRHNEFLGPDPGAFQSNGKSRDERYHRSNGSHDYGSPPRQHSPARSNRSSGSRASHSSNHAGLTPPGIGMNVNYGSNRSPNYRSTPEPQYLHDPPTPGKGFPEEKRI